MMNEKVHELLNQQINKEFYSAYLYLDFSNCKVLHNHKAKYPAQMRIEKDK